MTLVRNHLSQVLELHFPTRTVLAGPYGEVGIETDEEDSGQLRHLVEAGFCTLHREAAGPPVAEEAPEALAAPERKGNKSRREKSPS